MVELPVADEPSPPFGRTRHPYRMHEMIRRQAVAVHGTLAAVAEEARAVPPPDPGRRILFTGQGTSFHAALAGAWAARSLLPKGTDAEAVAAFDVVDHPGSLDRAGLVVVYSAAGETALTIEAQRAVRERGLRSILVSARTGSRSVALADHLLLTRYADEESWTHTVSYTAALAATDALLRTWAPPAEAFDADAMADAVTAALATEPALLDRIDSVTDRDRVVLLGSGPAEATAREGALKLREASGRFAAAVGVEEFLHGVLPSVNDRTAVLAIAGTPLERTRSETALRAAAEVGAWTLLVDTSGGPEADGTFRLPALPPARAPIIQVIPIQLLAYWLAVSDGRNPDVMGLDDPKQLAARRTFGI